MTPKQEKLIENYVRTKVRSILSKKTLKEALDTNVIGRAVESCINEIDSKSSGVMSSHDEIPKAIVAYLKNKYSIRL